MDPSFVSPPSHPRSLGDELASFDSYDTHPRSFAFDDDDQDGEEQEHDPFATSLSSYFSHLSGLGRHGHDGGGDLASELAGGFLASQLSHEHDGDIHFDPYPQQRRDHDEDEGEDGYRTPPRRGTRRRGGGGTPGGAMQTTLGDSLAVELDPNTTPPLASPSILDTPHFDRLASNVREIEESLRTTRQFLNRLRGVGSSLPSTSTASIPTTVPAFDAGTLGEDTTHLEQSAATLVRSLYDHANERETQIRELRDMLRVFGRNDADWLAALAEVDELEDEDDGCYSVGGSPLGTGSGGGRRGRGRKAEEKDFLGFATPLLPYNCTRRHSIDSEGAVSEEEVDDNDIFLSHRSPATGGPRLSAPLATHLTHLLTTTSGLIVSLTTIHEHSQVSKVAMNDVARRLRSIKTVMTTWKAEVDGVEKSRELIEQEREAERLSGGKKRIKDVKAWTDQLLGEQRKAFEEAESRAKVLLTPVSFELVAATA